MERQIPGIDAVFVIHCKKGYEDRGASIEHQFRQLGIEFEYILNHDIPELTQTEKDHFVDDFDPGMMSVITKHFAAMQAIVDRNLDRCLILEDDVLFLKDFIHVIPQVVEESKSLGDNHTVFLSNACHMYTPLSRMRPGQLLYEHDCSRAADSYLISNEACKRRLRWFATNIVKLPIDHLFNEMDPEVGIKFLWLGEPIIEQGSENGRFSSWNENNPPPIITNLKWRCEKFYKKHILRRFL